MGRPPGCRRDRVVLAVACACACVAAALLSAVGRGAITWGEVGTYARFVDEVVSTGSLASLPYPALALLPMSVAWLGGSAAWLLLVWLCLSGTAVLLARAAWAQGRPARAAWWWLACVVALGPVSVTRLEAPLSLVLVAALLAGSPVVRGGLLAAGVWTKAWPVVLAAAVLRGSRRAWTVCAVGLVAGLVLAGAAFADPLSWFTAQSARSLQIESLPAVGPVLLSGWSTRWTISVVGGLEQAFAVQGPGTALLADVATLLVFAVVVAAAVLCWRRRAWSVDRVDDATVVLVLASFLLAPVLSPQFLLTVVAVVAAVSVGRDRVPGAALLLVACALTQVVFPWAYESLTSSQPWAIVLLLVRQVLLVAVLVVWVRRVVRPTPVTATAEGAG